MGSVGGKIPTEPELYLFFSILRHIEQDEVNVYVLYLIIRWVPRSKD